jgi:hypothetical protein
VAYLPSCLTHDPLAYLCDLPGPFGDRDKLPSQQ